MAKRHDDALFIQTGACNALAVGKSLHDAMVAATEEDRQRPSAERQGGFAVRRDPAVRLIAHQLCHLLGIIVDDASGTHPASFVYDAEYAACLLAAGDDTVAALRLTDEREGVRRKAAMAA